MKRLNIIILALAFLLNAVCSQQNEGNKRNNQSNNSKINQKSLIVTGKLELDFSKYKVTFIELGADRCIPCRAMQPIMREIAEEFKGQVQVVFYDVWKDPRPARKYRIQLIPTQVFIDKNGEEFFRHVGFFPKDQLIEVLKRRGVK
ncbi:MAG: thioredoxin family protein [Candidatus Aminicenantaceae bacterium]